MTLPPAKSLYQTVASLGLTRAQVRRLLPSWWSPEIESQPGGVAELGLHLSRRLSLDLSALLEGRLAPKGAAVHVAFKHRTNVESNKLAAATFIASSLAQAIIAALPSAYTPLPATGSKLREAVRQATNGGVLGFEALLTLCWASGIPVIPLPHLPIGIRKMDGASLRIGDRPAIVIAKRKSSRAWLSFILAHEMAHIALGHIGPGSTIIDVSLQDTSTYATESSSDQQEQEADAFALDTLGGAEAERAISDWSGRMSPVELAVSARKSGAMIGVEPGHLILRHAFLTKRWAEASTALRFLSEDMDPESVLIESLRNHLALDLIADDLQDLVSSITGLGMAD